MGTVSVFQSYYFAFKTSFVCCCFFTLLWYFILKLWAAVVISMPCNSTKFHSGGKNPSSSMVVIAVMMYGYVMFCSFFCLSFRCPPFMCWNLMLPFSNTFFVDSDSGLLLLLYTIDDVRCVMWCESFVVVIDQFCGRDFVSTGWQRRILHPDMQVHCSV